MTRSAPPQDFISALGSLRDAWIDPSLIVHEVPAPTRLATWSAAVEIETQERNGEQPVAIATLVILCDPEQEEVWGGQIRLVGQARMSVDDDQSTDPLLGEVIWATLLQSLTDAGSTPLACVGTVTREISQTFGGLELQGSTLNADLRCSWTPTSNDLSADLSGWAEALRSNSGVLPHGVTRLGHRIG